MINEFTLTLDSPITKEEWDMITDVDFDYTDEITFRTKHGKEVKFVKASAQLEVIRCKDCKYWREYKYVNGKPKYLPYCGFNGTYFREDDYCSHAERREE